MEVYCGECDVVRMWLIVPKRPHRHSRAESSLSYKMEAPVKWNIHDFVLVMGSLWA